MTNKQLAVIAGAVVLVGLGATAYIARQPTRKQTPQPEGVCTRTRRVYAQAEDKHNRIKAKEEGEFFRCPWTTPEGLVEIEVERGNPQAIRWLQEQTAAS